MRHRHQDKGGPGQSILPLPLRAGVGGEGLVPGSHRRSCRAEPLPRPPSVWTGVKGDRCSETWVTLLHFGSKSIFDLVLMLRLWICGHRPCDVHKSTGRWLPRRGVANPAGRCDGRSSARRRRHRPNWAAAHHGLLAERLADANGPVPETDHTFAVDLANNIARPVLDRRQILAERPRAGAIARRRRRGAKRLMRPLMIMGRPPWRSKAP